MPHGAAAAANVNNGGTIVLIVAIVSMAFNALAFFVSGCVLVAWMTQSGHVHEVDTYGALNYAHQIRVEAIVEAHGVDLTKAGPIPRPPR